jgi:hypothetical protein
MTRSKALRSRVAEASAELSRLKAELERAQELVGARSLSRLRREERKLRFQLIIGMIGASIVSVVAGAVFFDCAGRRLPNHPPLLPPTPALLPEVAPIREDRPLYPGLARYGDQLPDRHEATRLLDWVNIGVAACTVGQTALADVVIGKLRETKLDESHGTNGAPNDVERAVAAVELQCDELKRPRQ